MKNSKRAKDFWPSCIEILYFINHDDVLENFGILLEDSGKQFEATQF